MKVLKSSAPAGEVVGEQPPHPYQEGR
jgi:hypothetical protein